MALRGMREKARLAARRKAWAIRTLRETGWRMAEIVLAMDLEIAYAYRLLRSVEHEEECPMEYRGGQPWRPPGR